MSVSRKEYDALLDKVRNMKIVIRSLENEVLSFGTRLLESEKSEKRHKKTVKELESELNYWRGMAQDGYSQTKKRVVKKSTRKKKLIVKTQSLSTPKKFEIKIRNRKDENNVFKTPLPHGRERREEPTFRTSSDYFVEEVKGTPQKANSRFAPFQVYEMSMKKNNPSRPKRPKRPNRSFPKSPRVVRSVKKPKPTNTRTSNTKKLISQFEKKNSNIQRTTKPKKLTPNRKRRTNDLISVFESRPNTAPPKRPVKRFGPPKRRESKFARRLRELNEEEERKRIEYEKKVENDRKKKEERKRKRLLYEQRKKEEERRRKEEEERERLRKKEEDDRKKREERDRWRKEYEIRKKKEEKQKKKWDDRRRRKDEASEAKNKYREQLKKLVKAREENEFQFYLEHQNGVAVEEAKKKRRELEEERRKLKEKNDEEKRIKNRNYLRGGHALLPFRKENGFLSVSLFHVDETMVQEKFSKCIHSEYYTKNKSMVCGSYTELKRLSGIYFNFDIQANIGEMALKMRGICELIGSELKGKFIQVGRSETFPLHYSTGRRNVDIVEGARYRGTTSEYNCCVVVSEGWVLVVRSKEKLIQEKARKFLEKIKEEYELHM